MKMKKHIQVHADGAKIITTPVKGGGIALDILCKCGKPISVSNKYGMFCEDMCGLKESKKASRWLESFISKICPEE